MHQTSGEKKAFLPSIFLSTKHKTPFCSQSNRSFPHQLSPSCAPTGVQVQATRRLGVADSVKKDNADMYAALENMLKVGPAIFKPDEKVSGTVVGMDKRMVYVDIGLKQPAVVPRSELSITANVDAASIVAVNDVREFAVLRQDGPDGSVTLSLKKLEAGTCLYINQLHIHRTSATPTPLTNIFT